MFDHFCFWSWRTVFLAGAPWIVVYLIAWVYDLQEKVQKK